MDFRVSFRKTRVLPPPDAGLHTLARGAEHAEAFAEHIRAKLNPTLVKVYGLRRRLATAAVTLFAFWLFVHVMLGPNGMVVYRTKRSEYQDLQKEINGLQKENALYSEQINQLKTDPKRIEKEAREQFHYARPGEVIYVSPEPRAPEQPVTHSASK
jgi:cell division protein FtsB